MLPSLLLLPRAVPGEAFPSLVRRIGELSGFGTDRALTTAMHAYAQHDLRALPKFIHEFCIAVDNAYGQPMEVLNAYTQFPYYGAVLNKDAYFVLAERLLNAHPGPGRPARLPVLMSTSPFVEPHCVECDTKSMLDYGAVVVFRDHLPVFVTNCPRHRCPLTSATAPPTYDVAMQEAANDARVSNAVEFSVRSGLLFEAATPGERLGRLIARFEVSGLRRKSGRFRTEAIADGLRRLCDGGFADSPLHELVLSGRAAEHSIAVLRRPGRALHPVYYILLDWLLDWFSPKGVKRESRQRREPLSEPFMRQELEAGKTVSQIAKENQLSSTTVSECADKYSIPRPVKPRRITPAVRRKVISMLEDRQPVAQVAKVADVSVSSVRRICRTAGIRRHSGVDADSAWVEVEAHRQRWLDACLHHPDWSRTSIRKHYPALWAWLYRHDDSWLEDHSPQRRRPRRTAWRAPLKSRGHAPALSAATSLDDNPTRPMRRSRGRMSRTMGLTPYEFELVAKSECSIEALVDTRSTFVHRRLRWAAHALHAAEGTTARWRVLKKACVRVAVANNKKAK